MAEFVSNQRTQYLNAEVQLDDCLSFFEEWVSPQELQKIRGSALAALGAQGRKIARKRYTLLFGKSGDTLHRSIKAKTSKNKDYEVVAAYARAAESPNFHNPHGVSNQYIFYGYLQAQGGDIQPRDPEKYLQFKINEKWIKTKMTHHNPKDFLSGPIEQWMNTNEPSQIMKQQIDKELIKLAKKYGVEVV